ncbi:MAG: alpha/beta hydrolase [Chlamydiota bacterium]
MFLWKWLKRTVYYLIIFTLLLAIAGTAYQLIREHLDKKKYPPPGELVDVGDYKLHYQLMGEGSPTVILDAGIGGSSIDWTLIQPEIAQFTSVFSYDRAGYGWSEEVKGGRTGWETVEDLNTLLQKQNIKPPYVLVGHSLGAAFMRLYASLYPEKVVGLVLVDPSHEKLEEESGKPPQELFMPDPEVIEMISQMGVQRILLEWTGKAPDDFPLRTQKMWLAKQAATKQTIAALRESEQIDDLLKELVPIESHIGDRPLVVISAGKRTDLTSIGLSEDWNQYAEQRFNKQKELHGDLVAKARRGKLVLAEDSDHMVPWNQPQVVVDAVREIVEKVREETDY